MATQLKMALVQSILTLHGHGWSRRRIARELGIHFETVGRHVDRPGDAGVSRDEPIIVDDRSDGREDGLHAPARASRFPEFALWRLTTTRSWAAFGIVPIMRRIAQPPIAGGSSRIPRFAVGSSTTLEPDA
ncbi:MAG TPA: hypothetical protein PLD59_03350 [Tepidisphaeraceae bacterium]|nr:hypothetical protein [Tepidisphaeraceae bacterium]